AGQLGRALQSGWRERWQLLVVPHAYLDITDEQAVQRALAQLQPDVIINAAAYTDVDGAEQEVEHAYAGNEQGPRHLARAAAAAGMQLIHVSTDYVFDGALRRPYTERDAALPLSVYGASKRKGEQAVLFEMPEAIVLRTSGLYSEYGNNFVRAMLRAASPVHVVADQVTCPTSATDLAEAIVGLIRAGPKAEGLYHYSGATALSWHDFAAAIFDAARRADPSYTRPELLPISTTQYAAAAPRPAYSVLSCEKIAELGIVSKPLDESLPRVVRGLMHAW
ncbi:MAG TPA: dTDP-4-dehydrorhamnose reductase, partial [Burkholderiaceae bacterium]|nr:dTDP-4-dehydrorhamnose reductase [Burkholderiaceae bacterium]